MFADPTFWALVGLVVFVLVLVVMKVPGMLAKGLDRRGEAIRNELAEAKRLRAEAESLLADYRRRTANAGDEAAAIVAQAKREAESLAAEAAQRIEDYVARRTKMAEQKIAQAEAQAVQEVRARSAEVAVAAAERILGAKVKGATADALVEDAIGAVRAKLN